MSAAARLMAGQPLYPQLAAPGFELGQQDLYLYPPPVALLFVPFLAVPFRVASIVWGFVLTALAVGVAIGVGRDVPSPRRPLAAALVLGALPVELELAYGNVTLVTLALALAAWRARGRTWPPAAALALAMGLKLLAFPLVVPFAIMRRPRVVVAAAALLAAVAALTLPFLLSDWRDWATLVAELATGPATRDNVVPSPFTVWPGRAVFLAAALGALAGASLLGRAGRLSPALAFAAALAAAPFVSAFVFVPYLLLALPLVVLLVLGDGPAWARAAGGCAWLLLQIEGLDPLVSSGTGWAGVGLALATAFARAAFARR